MTTSRRTAVTILAFWFLLLGTPSGPSATEIGFFEQGDTLSNAPDYDWWYGCSPTAAGMMMGYYDINGYGGQNYDNLVPGGVAELENFTDSGMLAKNAIASEGHIDNFYPGGTGASGDDLLDSEGNFIRDSSQFNSLADFMGTSQDQYSLSNGATRFYANTNGSKLDYWDVQEGIIKNGDIDGMYGIGEYVTYAGYGFDNLYTQLTSNDFFNYEFSGGFTFADYMAEINAGRVVMLHVENHSMFGYGYGDGNTIYLHDTWTLGEKSMTWGGAYSGLDLWGVTVLTVHVPEPATLILLFSCMLVFPIAIRRRKNCEKNFPI